MIAAQMRATWRQFRLSPFDVSTEVGRSAERHRRILLSAGATTLSKVLGLLVTIVSIPLVLNHLGAERFGIWSTLASLVITLQFIDLGIGNGLINAVSEAHGRGDRAAIRRYFSSAVLALSGAALLLLLLTPIVATQVGWASLFKLTDPLAQQEVAASVATVMVCIALAMPLALLQRVQIGLQQGFVASLWQCASNLISLVAIVLATQLQLGLPWLVAALLGAPVLAALLNSIVFLMRAEPDLRPARRFVTAPAVKRLLATGSAFFVLQLAVAGVLYSDSIIIAYQLGASAVAEYAVPERLFSIVSVLLATALGPLWPAYREAIVRGDLPWVKRTLRRSLNLAIGLSFTASLVLVLAGPWLMWQWVGAAVPANPALLWMLGLWKILESAGLALAMFLNGAGVMRLQVLTALIMLAATVLIKPWMVGEMGIVGAPLSTALIYFVVTLVPLAFVIRRELRRIRALPARAPQQGSA